MQPVLSVLLHMRYALIRSQVPILSLRNKMKVNERGKKGYEGGK